MVDNVEQELRKHRCCFTGHRPHKIGMDEETVKEYSIKISELVATGGGANSKKWLQIKSDIQNLPIKILRSSEGGLCGCAMLSAVALGGAKDFEEAKDIFVKYAESFTPDPTSHENYESSYSKYKKLYTTLKEIN